MFLTNENMTLALKISLSGTKMHLVTVELGFGSSIKPASCSFLSQASPNEPFLYLAAFVCQHHSMYYLPFNSP